MRTLIIIASMLGMIAGCHSAKVTSDNGKNNNLQVMWVNSYKVDCEGVAPMSCFQIQLADTMNYEGWTNLYQDIEGFEYQPGNIYKLQVRVTKLDPATLPADASSIRYELVKVLESNPDMSLRINDIWALESIGGEEYVVPEDGRRPSLEVNMAQRRIYGKAHCNNYFGSVKVIGESEIRFGHIGSTMMACPGLKEEHKMFQAFDKVRSWDIDNNRLTLKAEDGNILLVFRKVD